MKRGRKSIGKGILLGILVVGAIMSQVSSSSAFQYLPVDTDVNQDYISSAGAFYSGFGLTSTGSISFDPLAGTFSAFTSYISPMGSGANVDIVPSDVYLLGSGSNLFLQSSMLSDGPYSLASVTAMAARYGRVYGEVTATFVQPFTATGLVSYGFGGSVDMTQYFTDLTAGEYAKGVGRVTFEIGQGTTTTGFQSYQWAFDSTNPLSLPAYGYFTNNGDVIALNEGAVAAGPLSFDFGVGGTGFIRAIAFSSADVSAVPEPDITLLLCLGLGLMGIVAGLIRRTNRFRGLLS